MHLLLNAIVIFWVSSASINSSGVGKKSSTTFNFPIGLSSFIFFSYNASPFLQYLAPIILIKFFYM